GGRGAAGPARRRPRPRPPRRPGRGCQGGPPRTPAHRLGPPLSRVALLPPAAPRRPRHPGRDRARPGAGATVPDLRPQRIDPGHRADQRLLPPRHGRLLRLHRCPGARRAMTDARSPDTRATGPPRAPRPKAYVINLERAAERRRSITAALDGLGL